MIAWILLLTQPQSLLYSEAPPFDATKQNKSTVTCTQCILDWQSKKKIIHMPWSKQNLTLKFKKIYISSYMSGQDDTMIGYPSEQDVAILSIWDCRMCLQEFSYLSLCQIITPFEVWTGMSKKFAWDSYIKHQVSCNYKLKHSANQGYTLKRSATWYTKQQ